MRISDWSSDVCSSDLIEFVPVLDGDFRHPSHLIRLEICAGALLLFQCQLTGFDELVDDREARHQMVRETRQIDAFPAERSDLLHGRRANHYALRLVPGLALRFAEHPGQRAADNIDALFIHRSEERRVGTECVSPVRSWWSTTPLKKKTNQT